MLNAIAPIISDSQSKFADLLNTSLVSGPITIDSYQRYLSMQYHLTKGVQRYFITAAAHHDLRHRKSLRKFLVNFANEEELHYLVAANDLHEMNLPLLAEPFDATLWHAYFEKIVVENPFIRLGAACLLESISSGVAKPYAKQALMAPFLNRTNTKFLVLHQHETLPHGEQILEALQHAKLDEAHIADLVTGARQGSVMYLRMAEWALNENALSRFADNEYFKITQQQQDDISCFTMQRLEQD